jgi:hypothetical protein
MPANVEIARRVIAPLADAPIRGRSQMGLDYIADVHLRHYGPTSLPFASRLGNGPWYGPVQ